MVTPRKTAVLEQTHTLRELSVTQDIIETFNRGYYSVPTAMVNRNTLQYTPLTFILYHQFTGPNHISENIHPIEVQGEMRSLRTFNCSFCGERTTRNLRTTDIDQRHPTAFYCSPFCANKGREYHFDLLDQFNEREAIMLYVDLNLTIPEIADQLNLSPQVLRVVLARQIEARQQRLRAAETSILKSRSEDDIFAHIPKQRKPRKCRPKQLS